MKKLYLFLIVILFSFQTGFSQLSGTKTIGVDYTSIAAAISALNAQGVGAGGVTFNIPAGYTETFTSATAGRITASGSSSKPIIFQKSGSGTNPKVTAYSPGASLSTDAIIYIDGADYITFDGVDLQENSSNTTATQQMEWGYAMVKSSTTNGSQNITIKNCNIQLSRSNVNSVGIYSGNHLYNSTNSLTITSSSGTNSNLKLYNNNISDVCSGIMLNGSSAWYDQNNEIGAAEMGNVITNFGGTTGSSYAIYIIYQNNTKISANQIDNLPASVTSFLCGIYISSCYNSNLNIDHNIISLSSSSTSNSTVGIDFSTGNGTSNTININDNVIKNCTSSYSFYGIRNYVASSKPATLNIYNDTIRDITYSGSGSYSTCCGIDYGDPDNAYIYQNTIYNISGSGSSFFGIAGGGTDFEDDIYASIYNNSVYGVIANGSYCLHGYHINFVGSSGHTEIYNNICRDLIKNTGNSDATGIYAFGTENLFDCYNNKVYNLSSPYTCTGIYVDINSNVYKNSVYNLSSTGTTSGITSVRGIQLVGDTSTVYNNYIHDLKAPSAAYGNAVVGISVEGSSSSNVFKLFYNSVYITGTSSSTIFGSSGIYATNTSVLDMRNNIIVNTCTPKGATKYAVAYRRNDSTLTNYSMNSNNNCFYAGTPSANNLIYCGGTDQFQTLETYKARVGTRDSASISEFPPFINSSSTPYDLHLNSSIQTGCESGGQRITTPAVTEDYDGNLRWGESGYTGTGTTSDIGADEFDGLHGSQICSGTPSSSTINGVTSICFGVETGNLSLSTAYTNAGISYLWKSATISGGAYTNAGNNPALSIGNLAATTYYICIVTCENSGLSYTTPEKSVVVYPTPTAIATSDSPVCAGETLHLTGTSNTGTSFAWTGPNGFTSTAQNPSITSLTTDAAGTYSFIATANGCTSSASSVEVIVNTPPTAVNVVPSATTLCEGSIQQLTANGGITSTTENATVGNATTLTTASTQPTAFCNRWKQYWCQMVFSAAELQAAGLSAGNITSLTFNITSLGDGTNVTDFRIYMGPVGTTTLSGFTTTGLTQVYGPSTFEHSIGLNTITFTTPYYWDGVSNVLVDLRQTGADAAYNATTYYTSTTGNTVVTATTSSASPDLSTTNPAAVTSIKRLNIVFGFNPSAPIIWTPIEGLYTDANATIAYTGTEATTLYAKPTTTKTYTATATTALCTSSGAAVITVNSLPSAPSVSVTNNCGNSVLTASGYTGSLSWNTGATSPSITVTTSGNYTVTQTINGCTSTLGSGTASPKPIPSAPSISVTNNCGSSILTASGYTGNLSWNTGATSPSITVTTSGNYTVTQTINGCTSTSGYGTASPKLIPSAPSISVTNNCGSSILTASGYTGNLLWNTGATSPSITVTTGGNYTATQTVNGCISQDGIGIATPKDYPSATVLNYNNPSVCGGADGSILVTNNAVYTYLWNDASSQNTATAAGLTAGSYTVTITQNNGCSITLSQSIINQGIPVVTLGSDTSICLTDGEIILNAGNPGSTYMWNNGETSQSITVLGSSIGLGNHSYSVTVTNGYCESTGSIVVTVDVCEGIASANKNLIDIKTIPNPTKGMLFVTITGVQNAEIVICNENGIELFYDKTNNTESKIEQQYDFSLLPKGAYVVKVISGSIYKTQIILLQ